MPNTTYIGQPKANSSGLFSIVAQCDCGSEDGYVTAAHETKMANARLVAAAPELLAVARSSVISLELAALNLEHLAGLAASRRRFDEADGFRNSAAGLRTELATARAAIARATLSSSEAAPRATQP